MQRFLLLSIIFLSASGSCKKRTSEPTFQQIGFPTSCSFIPACNECTTANLIQFLQHLRNRINWHDDVETFKQELEFIHQQLSNQYQMRPYPNYYQPPPMLNYPPIITKTTPTSTCQPQWINPAEPLPTSEESMFVKFNPGLFNEQEFKSRENQENYEKWSYVLYNLGIKKTDQKYNEWKYVENHPKLSLLNLATRLKDPNYQAWSFVRDYEENNPNTNEELLYILENADQYPVDQYLDKASKGNYQQWSYVLEKLGIIENDPKYLEMQYVEKNPSMNFRDYVNHVRQADYRPWQYVLETENKLRTSNPRQDEWFFILKHPQKFDIKAYLHRIIDPNYKPWSFIMETAGMTEKDAKYAEWKYVQKQKLNLIKYINRIKKANYRPWSYVMNKPVQKWEKTDPRAQEWKFVLSNPDKFNVRTFLKQVRRPDYEPWSFIDSAIKVPKTDPLYKEWLYIFKNQDKFDIVSYLKLHTKPDYKAWSFVDENSGITKDDPTYNEWVYIFKYQDKFDITNYLELRNEPDYEAWSFVKENLEIEEDDPTYKEWVYILKNQDKFDFTSYLELRNEPGYEAWSFVKDNSEIEEDDPTYKEWVYVFKNQDKFDITSYLKLRNEPDYEAWSFVKDNSEIEEDDPRYEEWSIIMADPDKYKIEDYLDLVFTEHYEVGSYTKKKKQPSTSGWSFIKKSGEQPKSLLKGSYVKYSGIKVTNDWLENLLKNDKFVEKIEKIAKEKYPKIRDWFGKYNKTKLLDPRVYKIIHEVYSDPKFDIYTYITRIPGEVKVVRYSGKPIDPKKINWDYVNKHPDKFQVQSFNKTDDPTTYAIKWPATLKKQVTQNETRINKKPNSS